MPLSLSIHAMLYLSHITSVSPIRVKYYNPVGLPTNDPCLASLSSYILPWIY
ncbi:MAG: hypothetical protein IPH17_04890 [Bacteroidales bacterium]|nr:hypothetical protein [Bacteroidales bacterium]